MFEYKEITKIFQEQEKQILIDPDSVVQSQTDPSSLVCSICHHIVWNPLMCSIKNGCHTYFCTTCINSWVQSARTKPHSNDKINITCPNCKEILVLSPPPPILKCLLNNIKIKCQFSTNGCQQLLTYSTVEQHSLSECPYRNITCQGCLKSILFKDYQNHTQNCQFFIVQCCKCKQQMSKHNYLHNHVPPDSRKIKTQTQIKKALNIDQSRTIQCYSYEIRNYHKDIQKVQTRLNDLNDRYQKLKILTHTLIKGESSQLQINLETGFKQYFQFPQPTLIRSSFNLHKHRNEFLHFYISTPIYINSIVQIEWTLIIQKMKGNLLLGFCSSMGGESLDLIVNRHGQIKKKNFGQNKYKLINKAQKFLFVEKDVISFVYDGRRKTLIITNRTREVNIELGTHCMELFCLSKKLVKQSGNQCMYPFYSLDTVNDKLSFIQK